MYCYSRTGSTIPGMLLCTSNRLYVVNWAFVPTLMPMDKAKRSDLLVENRGREKWAKRRDLPSRPPSSALLASHGGGVPPPTFSHAIGVLQQMPWLQPESTGAPLICETPQPIGVQDAQPGALHPRAHGDAWRRCLNQLFSYARYGFLKHVSPGSDLARALGQEGTHILVRHLGYVWFQSGTPLLGRAFLRGVRIAGISG